MFQKILMTFIISFLKSGSGEISSQNNAFLCLIIFLLSFWAQMKFRPFITDELNNLNLYSNFVMILTILLGLFTSLCQNDFLETILLVSLILLNIHFIFVFMKNYLQLKMVASSNSKVFGFLNNRLEKVWIKGIFFFIKKSIFIFKEITTLQNSMKQVKVFFKRNSRKVEISSKIDDSNRSNLINIIDITKSKKIDNFNDSLNDNKIIEMENLENKLKECEHSYEDSSYKSDLLKDFEKLQKENMKLKKSLENSEKLETKMKNLIRLQIKEIKNLHKTIEFLKFQNIKLKAKEETNDCNFVPAIEAVKFSNYLSNENHKKNIFPDTENQNFKTERIWEIKEKELRIKMEPFIIQMFKVFQTNDCIYHKFGISKFCQIISNESNSKIILEKVTCKTGESIKVYQSFTIIFILDLISILENHKKGFIEINPFSSIILEFLFKKSGFMTIENDDYILNLNYEFE